MDTTTRRTAVAHRPASDETARTRAAPVQAERPVPMPSTLGRRPPGQNNQGQDQRDLAPENFCAGHCHPSLRKDRSGGHFPIRKDFSRVVASRRTAGKKYLPGAGRAFVMLDEDRGSRTIPGGSGGMESSANDGPNPDRTWIFWQYLPICSNVPTLQSGDRT